MSFHPPAPIKLACSSITPPTPTHQYPHIYTHTLTRAHTHTHTHTPTHPHTRTYTYTCPSGSLDSSSGHGLYDDLRLQALALLHTDLREVLLFQPGAFPVADPTPLFESAEFERTGAVFWPGLWKTAVNNPVWLAIDTDPHGAGWELQRG
jgi:hypothetical protein